MGWPIARGEAHFETLGFDDGGAATTAAAGATTSLPLLTAGVSLRLAALSSLSSRTEPECNPAQRSGVLLWIADFVLRNQLVELIYGGFVRDTVRFNSVLDNRPTIKSNQIK
jgi:hypothetical protein